MKTNIFKFVAFALAAIITLSSCDPKDVENPNNILAENMITVADVADAVVLLDNKGKTVDISIPYDAKDKINALVIQFNDLPTGAMVAPLNAEKDFSNNQRHNYTVTFADGEQKVYSVGVTFGALQPKFTALSLNGVAATLENGVYMAKLLASEDLKVVRIAYATNDPAVVVTIKNTDNDTYVALDTTAVNNRYNFEDKLNGRKIKLEYNGVSTIVTVKVSTSGYSKITKVWQTFANFGVADFYGVAPLVGLSPAANVPAAPSTDAWDRNIAMDDNYIYIARSNKHIQAESDANPLFPAYGIIAVKISDKTAKLLDRTGMYTLEETGRGAHGTSDVNVIGGKIVACNLANAANNILKVFVWDDVNAKPVVKLQYNVGPAPNPRLGDKFTFEGNWTNGVLRFVDYVKGANRYYEFKITNNEINPVPTIVTIPDMNKDNNTIGGIYRYSNNEFMFSGTGNLAAVFNPSTKVITHLANSAVFPLSQVGDAFFTFNDKPYLAYVFAKNTFAGWAVRIRPLDYPTLAESIEKISVKSLDINLSGLGADDLSNVTNGNAAGKVYVHTTAGGVTYIVAVAGNQGISLLKVE